MFNLAVMIIACPACATRYAVPDSAIGVDGRTVRCAKCRHSWFQDGPALPPRADGAMETAQPATPAPPSPPPSPAPSYSAPPPPAPAPPPPPPVEDYPEERVLAPAVAPLSAPTVAVSVNFDRQQPHAEPDHPAAVDADPPAAPEAAFDDEPPTPPTFGYGDDVPPPSWASPAGVTGDDDGYSSFAHEPPFRPRRNPAKMWSVVAIVIGTVSLALIGATAWWGLPSWVPFAHPLFAEAQPGLKLDFPARQQDRHQLPDGTWYFQASGTVSNVSQQSRSVPSVLIVLRDARDRVVYTAEVRSPKRVLAPGESTAINEALVQVPKAAVKAEFGWKPGS